MTVLTKKLSIPLMLLLAGCAPKLPNGEPYSGGYYDQDVRRDGFFECLRALPAGPQATRYNDWSEVVSECGSQATTLSARGFTDTYAAPPKVERQ